MKPPRYESGKELKVTQDPNAVGVTYPRTSEQMRSGCGVTFREVKTFEDWATDEMEPVYTSDIDLDKLRGMVGHWPRFFCARTPVVNGGNSICIAGESIVFESIDHDLAKGIEVCVNYVLQELSKIAKTQL